MWRVLCVVVGALVVGGVIGAVLDAVGITPAYDADMTRYGVIFGVGLALLAAGFTPVPNSEPDEIGSAT